MQAQLTPSQIFPLPAGDPGVAFTIQKMRALIDQGKSSSKIHALAQSILNQYGVRAFDWNGQARAIYDWVLRRVTFTPDVVGKESLQSAEWTATYLRGDCDCISVLMCSLLETVGMRCRLITVAADSRDPEQFSHVYPEVNVSGRWIPVDAARRTAAFGRSPRRYFRKRAWSVRDDEWADMRGLGIPAPMPVPVRARSAGIPLYYTPPPPRSRRYARLRGLRGLAQDDGLISLPGGGYYDTDTGNTLDATGGIVSTPSSGGGSTNWPAISQALQQGTTGAANIIAASRASPYNLMPTTYAPIGTPGAGPVMPAGSQVASQGIFGISTNTLLLLGLLAVGVMIARGR